MTPCARAAVLLLSLCGASRTAARPLHSASRPRPLDAGRLDVQPPGGAPRGCALPSTLVRTRGGGGVGSVIPVYKREVPMFSTFALMMFCTIFIFTVVRDTKDTLIVTSAGAEAIAFLKVYFVIPASMLFFLAYAKLSSVLSKQVLFVGTMLPFIIFYGVFGFLLYPLRDVIHLQELPWAVPQGLSYMVKLMQYWSFTLYYIVSELFGSVGVPLLFWQTANDKVGVEQAGRWYPLFSACGNLGPVVAGQASRLIYNRYEYGTALRVLTALVLVGSAGVLSTYGAIDRMSSAPPPPAQPELSVPANPPLPAEVPPSDLAGGFSSQGPVAAIGAAATAPTALAASAASAEPTPAPSMAAPPEPVAPAAAKKKKPKLTMMQSLAVLARSEYLGLVCALVLSYGLAIEFTEIMWKAVLKMAMPEKRDYGRFMGHYSTAVGLTTLAVTLVGGQIPKLLGWRIGALATPVVIGSLSVVFYAYITFGGVDKSPQALRMAVAVGTVQNVLSKATKYALFDPTKEMAYIPLDEDAKLKGKAAIDVLGARLGKSAGALIQQAVVVFTGSILAGAPVIAAMFSAVILAWISSVNKLNTLFQAKLREQAADKVATSS